MANSRDYRVPTGDDDADVPYWNDLLAQDVAQDVDILEAELEALSLDGRGGDAVGGIVDVQGLLTWLTYNSAGGPSSYAITKLLAALSPSINALVLAAGVGELNARGIAGGFIDSQSRETDLVFGPDGHVPDRVLNLWRDRMGTTGGLVTTTTRAFWGHSMAWGMTNGATPIGTYLATLLGKPVLNFGIGGQKSYEIGARVIADQDHRADITYLWPARNDLYKPECSPEKAVYWIRRMVEHQTAVRRKCLIFEEPTFGEKIGDANRAEYNAYNNAIKAAFPEYWVPLASWMLTDAAAASVGHTWTSDDLLKISQGTTPPSFISDGGHYNSLGNQAAANRIYQEEQQRGWI